MLALLAIGLVLVSLFAVATGALVVYLQVLLWAYVALGLLVLLTRGNHGN